MNRFDDNRSDLGDETELARERAVLEAAADPAPPTEAPPFFAARVRARAAEEARTTTRWPMSVAAARLLPVFGVLAMLLVGAASYESSAAAGEREAAVVRALASQSGGDMLMGAVLLAGPDDDSTGGQR